MDEYWGWMVKIITANKIIFECNYHCYEIMGVNLHTLPFNGKTKIYVYFYQKINYEQYFGFLFKVDKWFFMDLIKVNNVRSIIIVLWLLNELTLDHIILGINNQNSKMLQQCKAITPKLANNIINYFSNKYKQVSVGCKNDSYNQKYKLVVATLLSFGFDKLLINKYLLTNVNWNLTVEEIIATAIKVLKHHYY